MLFQLRRVANVASWPLTVNCSGTTQEQQWIGGQLLAGGTASAASVALHSRLTP